MRSILRYTPYKTFSSQKLSQAIQHASQNLKQQQSVNYIKYEELFFKMYTAHLARQKKVFLNVKRIDSMCMLSQFPCKSIAEYFLTTAKTYSEQYTVQAFIRLSRAYKISQSDNSSTADFSINRLFFTPAFENLIQQYKFGLLKQNAMSWDNAFLVADGLVEMGYIDYQVFSILITMVQTRLNKRQRNQIQIRPFQIEKKDYYMSKHRNSQQNLSNDPQFKSVLNILNQKVKSHEKSTSRAQSLGVLKQQLSSNQQSQNLYNSILESVSLIESYNKNLTKLIEGILTVRKQYKKMVQLSESKEILRHPEINLELLELQETLLVKKLISISDIKQPNRIHNDELELKRVEQILISMIGPEQASISSGQVGEFLNTDFFEAESKQVQKLNKLRDIAQYGRAIATLSRFAQASRRVYSSPDGRSLISMKWEKTLLLWQKSSQQTSEWRQNLHVQKIFRRTFADLISMIKRSYPLLMFTFVEAPLKYKIQFFESLSRLGFHDQLINLLRNQDHSKEEVQNYTNLQFSSLIKVLNEVGLKVDQDNLKKSVVKHLKRLFEASQFQQNKSLFSMQFCTNAVNFIAQNFQVLPVDMVNAIKSKDEVQILYEKLLNRLGQQAKYFDQSQNFLTNDQLYEALRVLSMEKVGQFRFDKRFFSRFQLNVQDEKQMKEFFWRKNPFNSIVHDLCEQYKINSPLKQIHQFIQTGFNSKGQLTAVQVFSSDQTSTNGKHVNGNVSAYIHRVKRDHGITITPLNVNSFLQIDYGKINQNKEFSFKSKQQISAILSKYFKRDELHMFQYSKIVSNIAIVLSNHFKKSYFHALVKFFNTLNQSVKLFERQKQIFSFPLFKFRRYRLFVQLDTLKEDYNLIDKSIKDEIDKLWKKQTSHHTNQYFRKNSSLIGFIDVIQQLILNSVDSKGTANFTKKLFEGKRFSIQSFIQNEEVVDSGVEFINSTAYIDKTYCPYTWWKKQIASEYSLQTVKLSQASNTTKILAKRFLPNSNQELSILPFSKLSALPTLKQYALYSLQPVKSQKNQSQVQSGPSISKKQVQNMKQLMSFVHELKMSKSEQQLAEYIFSFDFINELGKKSDKVMSRTLFSQHQDSYFQYLQAQNNKLYLQSANLQYLFDKLQQRQQISDIMKNRSHRRAEVRIEHQLGNISKKQYYSKVEAIDNQIIDKIKTLDRNILDNVEQYRLFQNGLKMIKVEQDQKELERVLNKARYYDRTLDKDFVYTKGNLQKCLRIKRQKAERTLSLYRVFYKISKGQSQLSDTERETLKKQISYVTYRLDNKKDHNEVLSEIFSPLTVGDLSKEDKQRLNLGGSNLSNLKNLLISDLVLEFVHLLDSKVGENFQKSIFKKYYNTKYGIPEQIFASSLNKSFSKLVQLQQRAIVNEHSKLDFYELGLLNEMVQTFKTESKTGKQRFANFYEAFYEDVEEMNSSEARVELISQYLNQKQFQYAEDYDPRLVAQIKERETLKLWNLIFKKDYNQSSSELIRQKVQKICHRIRLMGQNSPPFFGLLVIKILNHPSTDVLTKQNLISTIEHFKTPLKIDSEDIRVLGFSCSNQEKSTLSTSKELLQKLSVLSNTNFMENLNKKINMIV